MSNPLTALLSLIQDPFDYVTQLFPDLVREDGFIEFPFSLAPMRGHLEGVLDRGMVLDVFDDPQAAYGIPAGTPYFLKGMNREGQLLVRITPPALGLPVSFTLHFSELPYHRLGQINLRLQALAEEQVRERDPNGSLAILKARLEEIRAAQTLNKLDVAAQEE